MGRKRIHNYCDREVLHTELLLYKGSRVYSDKLIKMFYDVCWGYIKTQNIPCKYTREDYISYAMESLLKYSHNYNPDKGQAFSYITQIIKNSFRLYHKHYNQKYDYIYIIDSLLK